MQPGILCFNDALRRLETLGYWCVAQYQVGCPKLVVRVDKDLGFQNLVQTLLVYEAEVGYSSVWICKTIKKDKRHHCQNVSHRKF